MSRAPMARTLLGKLSRNSKQMAASIFTHERVNYENLVKYPIIETAGYLIKLIPWR